jgi:D-alanyl-D-alanine carboxypeptidase/D-alanyl-D-alanine-endopeptidase (penicillin-binding protein 4)
MMATVRNTRLVAAALVAVGLVSLSPEARSDEPAKLAAPAAEAPKRLDPAPIVEALAKLEAEVKRWGGTAGARMIDVGSGATIVALGEHAALNPASNAKLPTAAAALRLLGPHHRFLTGLYGLINVDHIDELVLRGDGDPSLSTRDLWAMAAELRSLGVRRVRSIYVDQSYFDDRWVPPAFEQQPNEWASFRAPVAPVSLNGNTVLFQVRPAEEGKDASVDIDPPGFVDLVGTVTTSAKRDPEKVRLSVEPKGSKLGARLGGSIPEGSRVIRVVKRVDDPRALAGYALRAALKQVGIDVPADPKLGGASQTELLVSHRSAELSTLIAALGKDSDNFYAEMLFKAIGAHTKGRPASADAGAEAVTTYLKDIGAFEPGVSMRNGSGLFDADRLSPWSITTLLRAAYRDPRVGPELLAQLSIGGVDGTARSRFKSFANDRAIRAKTGTLDAVAALSGYVLAPEGRPPLAFSVLLNGISGKVAAARPLMDAVVIAAANELWKGAR